MKYHNKIQQIRNLINVDHVNTVFQDDSTTPLPADLFIYDKESGELLFPLPLPDSEDQVRTTILPRSWKAEDWMLDTLQNRNLQNKDEDQFFE